MSHQDGRCATDADTIYVQNGETCTDGAQGGTAAHPFCSLAPALASLTLQRSLIVVRGVVIGATGALSDLGFETTIVGQSSGTISGTTSPALRVSHSVLYARDLHLTSSFSNGLLAIDGASIRLDDLLVDGSQGGGIALESTSFDITNTTVTGNGPGSSGALIWGGILVSAPPMGPARLTRVSVTNNKGEGIACTTSVAATGVYAAGNKSDDVFAGRNATDDIENTCEFTSCSPAGPTCGSQ
jgi:hypothetical protein